MFRTQIEIFTPRSFGRIPRHPEDGYMAEDVTESIIHQISEEKLIKRVQISDYIPNTVLEKLNRLFILRPDISFRVYGGADKKFGYGDDFNGWNLDFLRFVPDVQNIVIGDFEYKNTGLSILSSLSNLKSLTLDIYDLRGFSFVNTLPSQLEHLHIDADLKSGKPVFDCQWLLRLKNLQSLLFRTSSLQSFEFPKLTTVVKDFDLQCLTSDGEPGGEITSLRIPELTKVNGRLGVNNLGKMISLEFPKLQEVGSVDFASIPIPLETLSLPELSVVNGDLNLVSSYIASDAFTSTGNNKLQEIDGLSNLSIVKGTLTISKFQVLKKLPDWSKLEQLGGLTLLRLLECSDRILDLSKVNFVPFEDNEPLISITDGTIFSKIITKEDMSQVSMFLAPSGITGSSVGIDPELNFKSIKNFKYSSNMTTDPVFQFERVYGNMEIIRGSKKGVSAPNLVSVDGYLSIETTMANNISFPKLEIVGGQLCIIGNLNAVSNYDYDFTNLKSVGCSSNPQYIKEGVINNILYGSLDFMASNKDFTFPSLEHVGGVGMTVRTVKTISCPKLQAIDGTLCAANAASLTTFNMPTLTKLSGVRFIRLTRFVDYTFFKSFVEEEQIKKEDWLVTNCGYNPTYEDMQAGRYTQQ